VTLIDIHCIDFDSYIGLISIAAAVISVFTRVSKIPYHVRCYFNVVLALQSCSDSLYIPPGSSSDTNTTSGGVCYFSYTEIDEDIDVIEETFIPSNEGVERGINQEEIPGDITFPDIKSRPEKVSYVCICGLLLETFYHCPSILVFCQYSRPLERALLLGKKYIARV
jgi:hypothetical protein